MREGAEKRERREERGMMGKRRKVSGDGGEGEAQGTAVEMECFDCVFTPLLLLIFCFHVSVLTCTVQQGG